MSTIEIAVAVMGLLISSVFAFLAYKRGIRADVRANHTEMYTGYAGLIQNLQEDNAELRAKLDGTAITTNLLTQTKVDKDYMEALEMRLDRALRRLDTAEKWQEKAEKDLADCKKEMDEKIQALEARLEGKP